ncbi:AfsR/SARP family transcriptional regulator [Actinocrispum wychmicini]|uniref:DNA-binding SARP family transcriptional activator n=1 Tax=Actinocrispum wychmicini TaxID=1213861 RepID=A0A4R2JR71_9PSEU|nr:BTAD domain-containing putative transcriptional regulator [Actinocrispum wychmicini]TCO59708.1 DNA-binding SARP family transcriptional activator [Actinocrispum wychmicini]
MAVEFQLFGDVQAAVDDQFVDLGHARQRCVLAILLMDANQVVPGAQLVDRVWSEQRLPARPARALQTYLTLLRRAITGSGEVSIEWRSRGYRLTVDRKCVDVLRFRDLIAEARAVDADERKAEMLAEALRLWRAEPFGTLETGWLDSVRTCLVKERHAARLDLTDIRLSRGQHAMLVPGLYEQAAEYSLDERLAGQLMLALYRSGRVSDALAHYQDTRLRLADELGIDPSQPLRELHQQVLAADRALDVPRTAVASATPVVPQQLPAPPQRFTGRFRELRRLDEMLRTRGVAVSVVSGTGGVGKSWLALRWAHRYVDRFPDGQLFVNLRGFDPSGEPVKPDVAVRGFLQALGLTAAEIPADPDARAALYRSRVAGKRMLVVLDNARDSGQVQPLIPGSPSCAVLITSRRSLGGVIAAYGAHAVELDVLTEPEARTLLTQHADSSRMAAEPEAAAELLAACAGLPLALAIVGVRVGRTPGFPLSVLADELRESAARLDALDGGDLIVNVRAVLSWSHDALDAESRHLFALFGLTPGPDIGLAAAGSLTGLPTGRIRTLVRELENAHLVQQHVPGRYRMHDLVRLYAAERAETVLPADTRGAAARRVVDFYLHTAVGGERVLNPHRDALEVAPPVPECRPVALPDQAAAMRWFDAEYPCLLAAQLLAAKHGWHDTVWQLPWALSTFHRRQGHFRHQYVTWLAGLAAAERSQAAAAQVLAHRRIALACARLDRQAEGIDHLDRALALAERTGDLRGQAHTHQAFGLIWDAAGDDRAAVAHLTQAVRLFHSVGTPAQEAEARNGLGWYLARVGRYRLARIQCGRALRLLRAHNHTEAVANTLDSLRYVCHELGEVDKALDYGRQTLALYRQLGHSLEEANTLDHIACAHLALGQPAKARLCWQEAQERYRGLHRVADATRIQRELASLEGKSDGVQGDPADLVRIGAAAERDGLWADQRRLSAGRRTAGRDR